MLPSTVDAELLSRRQSTLNFLKNRRNSSMMSSISSPEPLMELIDAEDSLNLAKTKHFKNLKNLIGLEMFFVYTLQTC